MVAAKLNAILLAVVTEDLAQNVNFAIKAAIVLNFLETYNVSPPTAAASAKLDPSEIAKRAKNFTVFVECNEPAWELMRNPDNDPDLQAAGRRREQRQREIDEGAVFMRKGQARVPVPLKQVPEWEGRGWRRE
jgi:hypothetical protein